MLGRSLTWWALICSCSWEAEFQMMLPVTRASAFSVHPIMNDLIPLYSSNCLSACSPPRERERDDDMHHKMSLKLTPYNRVNQNGFMK